MVAAASRVTRSGSEAGLRRAVVLGSGLGEQCAFILAATGLGSRRLECWGYERQCDAAVVPAMRMAAAVGADNMQFVCGGAEEADLASAWLVVVNNNGWSLTVSAAILEYTDKSHK